MKTWLRTRLCGERFVDVDNARMVMLTNEASFIAKN
jgi:hypothetical protein